MFAKAHMAKLRIEFDRNKCIGAGQCRLSDPINFTFDTDDFHSIVTETEKNENNIYIKELETETPHMPTNAGIHCPVRAIKVTDMETGEIKAPKPEKKEVEKQ